MEIYKELPVGKIRPDPKQPRRSFNEEDVEDMAKSIKTSGIINAIEVDPSFVIITGEMRWRSAKKAGLKTIPVKILKIGKEDRFLRQVIENIHHNTMNDWDTAKALEKLRLEIPKEEYRQHNQGVLKKGGIADKGHHILARKIGKSYNYISEKFILLESSKPLQKAVREGNIVTTQLRILSGTPQEYRKEIEKKILAGEFRTRDAGLEVARALHRTPLQAKELLAVDYSKHKNTRDVQNIVSKLSPRPVDKFLQAVKPTDELAALTKQYLHWLDTHTPESVGKFNLHRCVVNLQTVEKEIIKWLKK